MKFFLLTTALTLLLSVSVVSADALKNSLNNLMNQKDSSGMVNLNGVGINAKPKRIVNNRVKFNSRPESTIIGHYHDAKPVRKKEADKYLKKVTKGKIKDIDLLPRKQRLLILKDLQMMYKMKHFKSRESTAVVATVNGTEIHKKEADTFLASVTSGKVKDFDKLDNKQRLMLIKDLVKPIILSEAIDENITEEEKEAIFKQMWLEKQRLSIKVSSEEMLALYEAKKKNILATNPQAQVPHYMSLGDSLKNEILEQKVMAKLMKDVNITVNYESNVTVVDTNQSSAALDKIQNTKESK